MPKVCRPREVTFHALELGKQDKVFSIGLELNEKSPGHPRRKLRVPRLADDRYS
jgi:hypothetical protein